MRFIYLLHKSREYFEIAYIQTQVKLYFDSRSVQWQLVA
jgi:hypothetical protein